MTKSSTFTVAQFTPPACTPEIEVTRAFTANTSGAEATMFAPGQTFLLVVERNSRLTSQVTIQARYRATGPTPFVLYDQTLTSTATPGPHVRFVEVPIPPSAPLGSYTFEASAIHNGVTSTKSATFTVASSSMSSSTTDAGTDPATAAIVERLDFLRNAIGYVREQERE